MTRNRSWLISNSRVILLGLLQTASIQSVKFQLSFTGRWRTFEMLFLRQTHTTGQSPPSDWHVQNSRHTFTETLRMWLHYSNWITEFNLLCMAGKSVKALFGVVMWKDATNWIKSFDLEILIAVIAFSTIFYYFWHLSGLSSSLHVFSWLPRLLFLPWQPTENV